MVGLIESYMAGKYSNIIQNLSAIGLPQSGVDERFINGPGESGRVNWEVRRDENSYKSNISVIF